jgi:hypothetical protein
VVYAKVKYDEATKAKTYEALVVPADDHQQLLHEVNSGSRFGPERFDLLPEEIVTSDPRFVVSDRAYVALTVSEERAVFAIDGFTDPDEISGGACGWLD